MISKTQENRADKVKQMDEVNVRDSYIPKELRDTAKRADEKSHIFKEQNLSNNMPKHQSDKRTIEKQTM
ncbi:hypothetical protein ACSQ67_005171 [Phaseolus vulgaris]